MLYIYGGRQPILLNVYINVYRVNNLKKRKKKIGSIVRPNEKEIVVKYNNLAPVCDVEKYSYYTEAIHSAMGDKEVFNIALTGTYGSGKSSILKTFETVYPKYKLLRISLATFRDNKPLPKEDVTGNNLIELSILQQIFYHVKHKQIKDSRFVRIKHLSTLNSLLYAIFTIIWTLSILVFFKVSFIVESDLWVSIFQENSSTWTSAISFAIMLFGSVCIAMKLLRIVNNSKINKLNIQGAEIEKIAGESILNRHLDEILYFFEVVKPDIVVIEDLDRFGDTEIFTKLREINALVNNSQQIAKRIVFIYAIKDDMFINQDSRTKFFEFIIPVIPVVSTSNSENIIQDQLKEFNLANAIDTQLISDVSLYIDDMRLLNNIVNEFIIYKKNLYDKPKSEIDLNKLFAIIIYKNQCPSDFANLGKNAGVVFDVFNKKSELVRNAIEEINEKIEKHKKEIETIEIMSLNSASELRKLYIYFILEINNTISSVNVNGTNYTLIDLENESNFSQFVANNAKSYVCYNSYYGTNRTENTKIIFSELEKKSNSTIPYNERLRLLKIKEKDQIGGIKRIINNLEKQRSDLSIRKLKDIASQTDISKVSSSLDEPQYALTKRLLRLGYIDENYYDYISFFYPGAITRVEKDFLLSVKNGDKKKNYNIELTSIDNVISRITELEFAECEVLNIFLIDHLVKATSKYSNQLEYIQNQYIEERTSALEFMYVYFNQGTYKKEFIRLISDKWDNLCQYVINNKSYTDTEIDSQLQLIFNSLTIDKIAELNIEGVISNYLQNTTEFLRFSSGISFDTGKAVLSQLELKISILDDLKINSDIYNYILAHNHYVINQQNIEKIISYEDSDTKESLSISNYTTILDSKQAELIDYVNSNISEYIKNVFLILPTNINEDEKSIIALLNNDSIELADKISIIECWDGAISDISEISYIEPEDGGVDISGYPEIVNALFKNIKVAPTWKNIKEYIVISDILLTEELYTYLNDSTIYTTVSKEKFGNLTKSASLIMSSNEISNDAYISLLDSFGVFNLLDISNLTTIKVDALINNKQLLFTPESYSALRTKFKNRHIPFLNDNLDKYFGDPASYPLDAKDIELLFGKLSSSNKNKLLRVIDITVLLNATSLCNVLLDFILSKQSKETPQDIILAVIKHSKSIQKQLKLVIREIETGDSSVISKCLSMMPSPYSNITPPNNPSLPNDPLSSLLVDLLIKREYISSRSDKEDKIRVYTKRQ